MSQAVILGGVSGLGIGLGLYALRLKQWKVFWSLALVVLYLSGVLVVGGVLLLVGGLFRGGGDAFMASATFLVFGVVGLVLAGGVMIVAGLAQNATVRQSALRCGMSLALDVIAVVCLAWGYQALVLYPQQREDTDQWWQMELQRRNEQKAEKDRIPAKYRDWTIPMIEAQRKQEQQMAKLGMSVDSPLPQDVEYAIRNYEYGTATSVQPVPNRSRYAELADQRKDFMSCLALGWLLGAVVLPMGNAFLGKKPSSE